MGSVSGDFGAHSAPSAWEGGLRRAQGLSASVVTAENAAKEVPAGVPTLGALVQGVEGLEERSQDGAQP